MINVQEVLDLHESTVEAWHHRPIEITGTGVMQDICRQHSFNYLLWHEEDRARCPDADDRTIADVKRSIDRYNQQRNDGIETVDDRIAAWIAQRGIHVSDDARLNSETPGSIIDRLSILALRIYHLHEQLERTDVSLEHRERVQQRLAICLMQRDDLATCLAELMQDISQGVRRHRTYRQLKMYNDPSFNPYLYRARARKPAA